MEAITLNNMGGGGRVASVDVAKFIGIFLMIMGHIPMKPYMFNCFLFSFHMPLFFLLSGLTYKNVSFMTAIKKSCCALLIPYATLQIFLYLWYIKYADFASLSLMLLHKPNIENLQKWVELFRPKIIAGFFFTWGYPTNISESIAGQCWFLLALFWCRILFSFIDNYKPKKINSVALHIVSSVAILLIISHYIRKGLFPVFTLQMPPFSIGPALMCYPFFVLGKLSSPYILTFLNSKGAKAFFLKATGAFVLFIITFALCIANGRIDTNYMTLGNSTTLFYINALTGIFMTLCLASLVKAPSLVLFYGKNTIIILAFHIMILPYVARILSMPEGGYSFSQTAICAALDMVICTIPILIITRGCPVVLGKFVAKK